MKRAGSKGFTSNAHGGSRQRLAKQAAVEQKSTKPSTLADYLLLMWSSGLMSTSQIQCIMNHAKEDMDNLAAGVVDMSAISRISGIGSAG